MGGFILRVLLLLFLPLLCSAEQEKDTSPIRVIENDWTSQIVLSRITGMIFIHQGYKVRYVQASSSEQWGALALGIDHVQVEVWQGTMELMFNRMVSANRILDAGTHSALTREDWWYPGYVEELCPGLPDWRALKRCAKVFATEKTNGKGRYVAGPWEKPEAARIRALELDFIVDQVQTADDLWRELAKAQSQNKAIVLFNWTPNWVEDRYDGKFIEFPAYEPECETDPKWGVNPLYHYDCGNPSGGWLKKAAWSGMPKKWNCAYRTLKNVNFDNATIAQLSARVDVDKLTHEQAAEEWYEANRTKWESWIPDDCH
ncbi:ABC transporter substrate-binding protein [Teredinibacter sp. KSP-S5-2]|uniref:ABC transporter substrate-binding protein n=1 Tax=Teredinibacter sp. KSP-S5-2 TaxID=3034506 RepID=UPI002934E635|nr:ABC transporter substrate-binding protein [Teredinibacter sp. KSP-S5-2]WNO10675.1 ABC transporter substrate-binding protein [Teredinibacter sp. KSP-S5-2]